MVLLLDRPKPNLGSKMRDKGTVKRLKMYKGGKPIRYASQILFMIFEEINLKKKNRGQSFSVIFEFSDIKFNTLKFQKTKS